MNYQEKRNVRREARTLVGRFRGGKLVPVMAVPVRGNEGGLLAQNITMELEPIMGRMITPITGEIIAVFVPVQAIDAIKDPEAAYAGMTEVIREKLLTGNPLFGLEAEGEISKRCGVNPRSIAGVKSVNEMIRLAHNAAVNYLRQRKYVNAATILHSNTALTPALISQTVLERLNGVLDPEDRVNGAVNLELPNVNLPIHGIGIVGASSAAPSAESAGSALWSDAAGSSMTSKTKRGGDFTFFETEAGIPKVFAELNAASAGSVSLTDFYNAEKMDALTRVMRQIVDENPEYGEEMVLRWAHGLSVDTGKVPFVLAERRAVFGRSLVGATDATGIENDVMRSDMAVRMEWVVPIPQTELGGIILTFAALKPDETLSSQPHPFLSDVWGLDNFVADELAIDPVPVTIRELDSDCLQAEENTVALYTGLNGLKATYVNYGFNRAIDQTTVENKTAIWQLEVPMSVTPESVLYPETLDHFPFAVNGPTVEPCVYTIQSMATVQTPMIIGPTPVEELAVLETGNVFEDVV